MDCKEALRAADGDMEKAVDFCARKAGETGETDGAEQPRRGSISSYIHTGGKVGAMAEVNCETDFVGQDRRVPGFRQRRGDADYRIEPLLHT